MAWARQELSSIGAIARVIARVWGLGVAAPAALALAGAALIVGDVVIDLPGVPDAVAVLHLWPGLTALALAFPLVDRTPDLTLLSVRRPAVVFGLRLAGVVALAAPVAACLLAAGWSAAGGGAVLGFVGVAALGSALLGNWYWAPMLVLLFGWLQWPDRDVVAHAGGLWLGVWLALLLVGGGGYLLINVLRVARVVRAVGAGSGGGRSLDTIRP